MSNLHHLVTTVQKIAQRSSVVPVLVAIDGYSAAGKSTLARRLAEKLINPVLITTDDFYRPMPDDSRFNLDAQEGFANYYDWQRLREEVLNPLSRAKVARFHVYDWSKNVLGHRKTVVPNRFIIVEGCYAARPELAPFYDVIVFVDTSPTVRSQRQLQRNDATPAWLARWEAAEQFYIESTKLPDRADFVVRGDS